VSKQSSLSSLESTLIYSTTALLFVYMYMTIVTFQELPPIPSFSEISLASSASVAKDDGNSKTFSYPVEELGKYTKFPQSIDFVTRPIENSPIDSELELIVHPAIEVLPSLADQIDDIYVPKFYDPSEFQPYGGIRSYLGKNGERLMTLAEAKTIGSYVDGRETIYVAIASYRDFQCKQTVESIMSRAVFPQRVRIAVVDQLDFEHDKPCSEPEVPCTQNPDQILCKYKSQLDFYTMDASYAVGPVFARHLGHRMYRGEYFAMQCDAHVDFVKDWDVTVIEAWKSAKNEMGVLTAYLSDVNGAMDEEGNLKKFSRPIMCKSDYEGYGVTKHLRHGQQPEGITRIHGEPSLEPFWAAGFSFSRGHFVLNVPYDQHLPWIFQGEEISIGLRGFTYGYDYYTPEHSVCFHYYAKKDETGKRNKVHTFWENSGMYKSNNRAVEKGGMKRLNGILNMNPSSIKEDEWMHDDIEFYGLGKVRTTQKFFETFGIDTETQKTQDHLCRFVGINMQKAWKPHLRENTMGINYDEISFKFQDPDIYGSTWVNLPEFKK